jgi:hypothetical protein
MNHPTPHLRLPRHCACALLGLLTAFSCGGAWGNDRPFQVARTAVMEDEEQVWSVESWGQRYGTVRGASVEPEYTFSADTSVQFELSRFTDRSGIQTGYESEVEFKHLFNDIHREGWGWGVSAALGAARTHQDGTTRSLALKLPLSIALGEGGAYLHLDAGVDKTSGVRPSWSTSAAIEREFVKNSVVFAELAHQDNSTFLQAGVRHWLRRDKLALDLALQQQRREGQRASGFILGLGWYDL